MPISPESPVVEPDSRQPGAPVITIDGPTASGKGTIALGVASALGWHSLDSGALYRLVAQQALARGMALDDASALARLTASLEIEHGAGGLRLNGRPVGDEIRREEVGTAASRPQFFCPHIFFPKTSSSESSCISCVSLFNQKPSREAGFGNTETPQSAASLGSSVGLL